MAKRQGSLPKRFATTFISIVQTIAEWVVILLFYASLPITRYLFSRAPEPPTLQVRDVRWDKVKLLFQPNLTSRFNVERYTVLWRLAGTPIAWLSVGERGRPGGELEVYAPEEGVKLELKARAENDRGVSAWSKPLRVRTRHKAVEGGCDAGAFKWTQTRADVTLHMPVPRRVAGRDLRVSLKDGQLHISVSGELHITVSEQGLSAVWVEGTLRNPAKGFGDGSVWELVREGDGKMLNITLEQETPGKWWSGVLKGGPQIDLHTIPGYDPPPFDRSVFSL